MTRRMMVAGNWKLHMTIPEALEYLQEFRRKVSQVRDCDIVLAAPYTALYPMAQKLSDSNIHVSGQDVFFETKGAYTGTVSAPMLKDAGCSHVLVGHSERRSIFGETLESSRKRMAAALDAGLIPILCVGETLEERESERTTAVVTGQLEAALEDFDPATELADLVIAYEPVWAIGTGKVATPAQAQEVHAVIREWMRYKGPDFSAATRLLYGGSVKPGNAQELMAQVDIDGVLVGGASLKPDSFADIVKARKAE